MEYSAFLTDEQWIRIEPHLPGRVGTASATAHNNRRFFEAIVWVCRTGSPWRDLPPCLGKWNSIYQRFRRWAVRGVFTHLRAKLDDFNAIAPTIGHVLIDNTVVRAHQHAAGACGVQDNEGLGRSRGGFSTKIHAAVWGDFRLLDFCITAGQVADITEAEHITAKVPKGASVIADKGYDADEFVAKLNSRSIDAIIPPRKHRLSPRSYDAVLYKQRNVVERFFARIKQFRRVATRYNKTCVSFAATFLLACFCCTLRGLG